MDESECCQHQGADPVSTGVVEDGISEPWTLTTIKRGKKVTDNSDFAFAA